MNRRDTKTSLNAAAVEETNLKSPGQKTAAERRLILVDTKYELGLDENGEVVLIDEIHTPDSSRYWLAINGELKLGKEPENYDKEYKDETLPTPPQSVLDDLIRRYLYVYEQLGGETLPPPIGDSKKIERSVLQVLEKHV